MVKELCSGYNMPAYLHTVKCGGLVAEYSTPVLHVDVLSLIAILLPLHNRVLEQDILAFPHRNVASVST